MNRAPLTRRDVAHWAAFVGALVLAFVALAIESKVLGGVAVVVALYLCGDVDRSREDSPPSDWGWP